MKLHTTSPYFPPTISEYAPWVAKHGLFCPYGKCQCGCGQNTRIARQDNQRHGHKKGEPLRFLMNHRDTPPTLADKFWKYITPDDPDKCWEWQGSIGTGGYGKFWYRSVEYLAHRVAWSLHNGKKAPAGLVVCHTCDNPRCVNPHHLFVGTIQENTADRDSKNRQARGERGGTARLTEVDIISIRAQYASGKSQEVLAEQFGIEQTHVSSIVRGLSWKHAGGPMKASKPSKRLTKEQAETVRQLAKDGHCRIDLERRFGVTKSTVNRILAGKTHA